MKEDRKIKNVVLIMLDTLQFNYLGCYGNKVVKTPNIDRLARQGFLFENAYSEGLPTVPVRRALMTGRFTLPYGGWQPLAPDDTTVADIMWGKNMQTALVYDTPPMRLPKYGYSRGFDFVSFNPGQELDHTSFADVPLDPALKPEDYTSPTMVFNEKGEVIDDDSTQLLDEIGCFLRQQQFRKPEDSYISRVMTVPKTGCPTAATRPAPSCSGWTPLIRTNLGTRNPCGRANPAPTIPNTSATRWCSRRGRPSRAASRNANASTSAPCTWKRSRRWTSGWANCSTPSVLRGSGTKPLLC